MFRTVAENKLPGIAINPNGVVQYKGAVVTPVKSRSGQMEVIIPENGINYHFMIHLLMRDAFFEKQAGYVMYHTNGDIADNRLPNLEYISMKEFLKRTKKEKLKNG